MDESAEADDDQPPKSALAWQLPERLQMPRSVGRRCFPAQDVEIAVICTDFVKGILRAVPLVQHFLDHVLVPVQPKANRPFVRRPTGIAIHLQSSNMLRCHFSYVANAHRDLLLRESAVFAAPHKFWEFEVLTVGVRALRCNRHSATVVVRGGINP